MSEPIHVLFWPGWWYPCRLNPYSGIFIKKHAEAVSRFCRVSVLYITPDPALKKKRTDWDYREEDGVPTLRVYYRPPRRIPVWSKISEFIVYRRIARKALRFLEDTSGKTDLVHVQVNPPAALVHLLFFQLRKLPRLFTEHWSGYFPASRAYRGILRKWVTGKLVKGSDLVTTVSHALQKAMEKHGLKADYRVVPNVVDTELFRPLPGRQVEGKTDKATILHVSGLSPVKNCEGMLLAVARIAEVREDFRLLIVGDGPCRKDLETLAREHDLLDTIVFFEGAKPVEEVAGYMAKADFFLLFSHYENSPCVLAEAMACGLPAIAPRVGGIPEHLDENNGILVTSGDEEELYSALNNMLDYYQSFDREKIRQYAVEHFSYPRVGETFHNLYREILNKEKE